MSRALPALRLGLDVMPSPIEDRPGLLIRDPLRYSDSVLVVPPALVGALRLFDGERTPGELREALARMVGEPTADAVMGQLVEALGGAGFLEDATFAGLRERRHQEFAAAARREPAHAGTAYPAELAELHRVLERYLAPAANQPAPSADVGCVGIVVPHVSPEGGWRCYQAGFAALDPALAARTFVVLGTSHYGAPEHFGLTRKPFATPLGETLPDLELVDRLAGAGPASVEEDYCHAVEHSIEFQVLFLQKLFGAAIRVLPILCGPFARTTLGPGRPEDDSGVARFLEALARLARAESERLFWVLGVDLAHVGRRYGDPFRARARLGRAALVEAQDRGRLDLLLAGDADAFWADVRRDADPLRWCGASPLYTFLRAVGPSRGELLRYEQWNIDDASVVSFAAVAFNGYAARTPRSGVS